MARDAKELSGSREGQIGIPAMRIVQVLALLANLAALAWVAHMLFTYPPLTRELAFAGLITVYPVLNLIALAGLLRRPRPKKSALQEGRRGGQR